jgi:CDP-6-deoxy-D-xylo-4-hexulose-3-dehydrase
LIPLAINSWGEEEKSALLKVVESGNYTMGAKVSEFEKMYAGYVGTKYCVACNSGSSANLLMVAAMSLRQGVGTVIAPAVSWSTSYSPFQQYGWKIKFVDIDRQTLNYDLDQLNKAYTGQELVLAVNLLGNPNDFMRFPTMDVLEDNCESMGAEYEALGRDGDRIFKANLKTGSFGIMSSHSTFFSHHIQTMEGGMVTTDDETFYEMLLCLRSHGWTRHLPKDNVLKAKVSSYEFIYPGYNVRPLEVQAAVGVEQLKKLPKFIEQRRENAERFKQKAKEKGWTVQKEIGKSSWFAFSILADDIEEVKKELDSKGIEHRPVVAGNFVKSDSIKYYDHEVFESLPNADYVHSNGLYIGNNHQPIDWSSL